MLEYYTGILFLTTNRVGDFDEAFTSRIHISLHYPELDREKTLEVFRLNMAMIEERFARQGRRINIDKMGIGSFASDHFLEHHNARWNGRQIRNACQTALALAEFKAQGNSLEAIILPDAVIELTVEHFNTVRNAYVEFTNYMTDLYGSSAARRAKESRIRAIWVDENDRIVGVGGSDKKAFSRMAQTPSFGSPGRQPPIRQGFYPQQEPQPQYERQGFPHSQDHGNTQYRYPNEQPPQQYQHQGFERQTHPQQPSFQARQHNPTDRTSYETASTPSQGQQGYPNSPPMVEVHSNLNAPASQVPRTPQPSRSPQGVQDAARQQDQHYQGNSLWQE